MNRTTDQPTEPINYAKLIGKRLQGLRKAQGLRVEDMAARINVPTHAIYSIEGGKYNPGIKQLCAYARELGYDLIFQRHIDRPSDSPTD